MGFKGGVVVGMVPGDLLTGNIYQVYDGRCCPLPKLDPIHGSGPNQHVVETDPDFNFGEIVRRAKAAFLKNIETVPWRYEGSCRTPHCVGEKVDAECSGCAQQWVSPSFVWTKTGTQIEAAEGERILTIKEFYQHELHRVEGILVGCCDDPEVSGDGVTCVHCTHDFEPGADWSRRRLLMSRLLREEKAASTRAPRSQ